MTSFVLYNDKKIEVLDKQVFFEPGEQIFVEVEGKKEKKTITNIVKVLRCNGDMCDVVQEIYVT